MNINHRTYETFRDRLQRLIKESGVTDAEFAVKIKKSRSTLCRYLSGEVEPNTNTLIIMADCLNVTIDYLLCRKSSVLSLQSHKDNSYIFDKTEFGFTRLTHEYDNFLASILGNDALVKSSSDTISLMSLLVTIFLRDTVSIYKGKDSLSAENCRAYLYRSDEIHKIVSYLMYRLTHDIISDLQPGTQIAVIDLNVKETVLKLISLFVNREDGIHDIFVENMLLTLENAIRI